MSEIIAKHHQESTNPEKNQQSLVKNLVFDEMFTGFERDWSSEMFETHSAIFTLFCVAKNASR